MCAWRKSDGFASLGGISVGLHLHDLALPNGVDIGNIALSRLAASLRPGLEVQENSNLVSNFKNLFRHVLNMLVCRIREREVIDD